MGASSWIYYTPYQENLGQALQELRQHVFETDTYNHFWRLHDYEENTGVVDISGEEIFPLPPPPQTIEEVVQRSMPEGTHSILDISCLITDSRYYGDVPLPQEIIQLILEGARPTRAMVEAIVLQEQVWLHLSGWFRAEHMNRARGSRGIYAFSEEILQFFAVEHPKEEIVEVFFTREEFWRGIHRCLCSVIEALAMRTRIGRAMPLPSEDLVHFFGNEKPTRAEVEAAFRQEQIRGSMRVGVGYYAIIYQDEVPHEIVFVGASGD